MLYFEPENDLKFYNLEASTGPVGLWFLWFYVQEHTKTQPAVALVLKHLRRRGHGLKSHPTDIEAYSVMQL